MFRKDTSVVEKIIDAILKIGKPAARGSNGLLIVAEEPSPCPPSKLGTSLPKGEGRILALFLHREGAGDEGYSPTNGKYTWFPITGAFTLTVMLAAQEDVCRVRYMLLLSPL